MNNFISMLKILFKITLKKPMAISFNVTHDCNLSCIMCNIHKTKIEELPLNKLEKIMVDLKKAGFLVVEITGGEPFIRKDIFDIFDILERLKFRYTINTNGTLLNRNIVSKLKDYPGILQVAISIDSLIPSTFERIRGHDVLSKVLRGVDYIIEQQLDKPIKINLTLNLFNYNEIDSFLTFCREKNVYLSVFPVNLGSDFRHRSIDNSLIPTEEERNEMALQFERLAKLKKNGERLWEHSSFYKGAALYIRKNKVEPCDAGKLFFDLHADGKLAVCNDLPAYGDLKKETFQQCYARISTQQDRILKCYKNHPCYYTCTYAISAISNHKISYLTENLRMMGLSHFWNNFFLKT